MAVTPRPSEVSEEAQRFAETVRRGTTLSLLVLGVTFVLYLTGAVRPLIPIAHLPRYWGLRAVEFLVEVGLRPGWGWAAFVTHGDMLNLVGVVMLGTLSIAAYAVMLPVLIRRRDRVYTAIAVAQLGILALAASGLVALGH